MQYGPRTDRSKPPPGLIDGGQPAMREHGIGTVGRPVPADEGASRIPASMLFRWNEAVAGFGISSRSRFLPWNWGRNVVDGHGGAQAVRRDVPPPDPAAGRTMFKAIDDDNPQALPPYPSAPPGAEMRTIGEESLGRSTVAMLREGDISQVRNPFAPQDGDGTRLMAPFDPLASGPHGKSIRFLYGGYRREAFQNAQSFSGLHTRVLPGAKYSSYPRRMAAARVSRLTVRQIPASYGASTEIVGPGEYGEPIGAGPGSVRLAAPPTAPGGVVPPSQAASPLAPPIAAPGVVAGAVPLRVPAMGRHGGRGRL